MDPSHFEQLKDTAVFLAASYASTISSMYRFLAKEPIVKGYRFRVENDLLAAEALVEFTEQMINADYDPQYQHPHAFAICAALVVMDANRCSKAVELMTALSERDNQCYAWPILMARHILNAGKAIQRDEID